MIDIKRYIRTDEPDMPTEGNVGIWWIHNNFVIGEYCPVSEGVDDRGYIQFSKVKNHITEWESTIKEQLPEAVDLIPKGYRCIERGRVVYDVRSQVYEIICSQAIANDEHSIQLIADAFEISNLRYDVIPTTGNSDFD